MNTFAVLARSVVVMSCLLVGCKKTDSASPGGASPASTTTGNHDASGPISEAALGLKIYPGAKIVTSGETAEVVSANLQTADSPEKVIAFYRKELGVADDGSPATDLTAKKNGRLYVVTTARSEGVTSVSIMGKK